MTELDMIKTYIDSGEISEGERKFLINYMIKMKNRTVPLTDISVENVVDDVRRLNQFLQDSDDTILVKSRINKELDIINTLSQGINDKEKLVEASYQLEQLYYQSDMPIRNTNTVFRKIEQSKKIDNSRGR